MCRARRGPGGSRAAAREFSGPRCANSHMGRSSKESQKAPGLLIKPKSFSKQLQFRAHVTSQHEVAMSPSPDGLGPVTSGGRSSRGDPALGRASAPLGPHSVGLEGRRNLCNADGSATILLSTRGILFAACCYDDRRRHAVHRLQPFRKACHVHALDREGGAENAK
jgi:hypothetical protein